ncbi:hypothetical protein PAEPH01_0881 [Pancytospora epiphaga]|nr:hypothetical protein PAEPH01_0881 [Pancytospora epiphaga]
MSNTVLATDDVANTIYRSIIVKKSKNIKIGILIKYNMASTFNKSKIKSIPGVLLPMSKYRHVLSNTHILNQFDNDSKDKFKSIVAIACLKNTGIEMNVSLKQLKMPNKLEKNRIWLPEAIPENLCVQELLTIIPGLIKIEHKDKQVFINKNKAISYTCQHVNIESLEDRLGDNSLVLNVQCTGEELTVRPVKKETLIKTKNQSISMGKEEKDVEKSDKNSNEKYDNCDRLSENTRERTVEMNKKDNFEVIREMNEEISITSMNSEVDRELPVKSIENKVINSIKSIDNNKADKEFQIESASNEGDEKLQIKSLGNDMNRSIKSISSEVEISVDSISNDMKIPIESVKIDDELPVDSIKNEISKPIESIGNEVDNELPVESLNKEVNVSIEPVENEIQSINPKDDSLSTSFTGLSSKYFTDTLETYEMGQPTNIGPNRPISITQMENSGADSTLNSKKGNEKMKNEPENTVDNSIPFEVQVECGACGADNFINHGDINELADDLLGSDINVESAEIESDTVALGFTNMKTPKKSRCCDTSASDDSGVRDTAEPLFVVNMTERATIPRGASNKSDYVISEESSTGPGDIITGSDKSVLNVLKNNVENNDEEITDLPSMDETVEQHRIGPISLDGGKSGRRRICEIKILLEADMDGDRLETHTQKTSVNKVSPVKMKSPACSTTSPALNVSRCTAGSIYQDKSQTSGIYPQNSKTHGSISESAIHGSSKRSLITFVESYGSLPKTGDERSSSEPGVENDMSELVEYEEFIPVEEMVRKIESRSNNE